MKAGAHSFIEKPIRPTPSGDAERAIERRDLVTENLLLKQKVEGSSASAISSQSKKMHEVLER